MQIKQGTTDYRNSKTCYEFDLASDANNDEGISP
jgi:hypothetical protein